MVVGGGSRIMTDSEWSRVVGGEIMASRGWRRGNYDWP